MRGLCASSAHTGQACRPREMQLAAPAAQEATVRPHRSKEAQRERSSLPEAVPKQQMTPARLPASLLDRLSSVPSPPPALLARLVAYVSPYLRPGWRLLRSSLATQTGGHSPDGKMSRNVGSTRALQTQAAGYQVRDGLSLNFHRVAVQGLLGLATSSPHPNPNGPNRYEPAHGTAHHNDSAGSSSS